MSTTQTGIALKLSDENGNAFSIIARATSALKRAGRGDLVDTFMRLAQSGDYDHLLQTCMRWFDVE